MKIASFTIAGTASFGIVTDNGVIDAGKRLKTCPTLKTLLAKGSLDELKKLAGEKPDYALQDVTLLPTVPDPDKIFCVGVNYATHLAESGHPTPPHPMIFTRFANSQVGHGQPMIRPLESERFDYEGEMAVVIGKAGRRISREAALSHVAGYACYNDGSIRDWQRHTSQFAPGKNFAGTGGFGPWMVTTDELTDVTRQTLITRLNGVEVQKAPISDLVFDVQALIDQGLDVEDEIGDRGLLHLDAVQPRDQRLPGDVGQFVGRDHPGPETAGAGKILARRELRGVALPVADAAVIVAGIA